MSAQLLYKMIKSKTEYPLHKAIKVEREDVVFLYLIEMDSQVSAPQKLSVIIIYHPCIINISPYAINRCYSFCFYLLFSVTWQAK